MDRQIWKPGNMLYPLPVVLVTCSDGKGNSNIFTVAWTGTVCSDPPMVSISVRPQRYSHSLIHDTGEFVINLTTRRLVFATDYCGVRSGRDVDKFREMKLTALPAQKVGAPLIGESPVNIECRVFDVIPLGVHDMFLADVVAVHVEEELVDESGKLRLDKAHLAAYAHGDYFALGKKVGSFGFSVRKKRKKLPPKGK